MTTWPVNVLSGTIGDTNSAPFSNWVAATPGQTITPGRAVSYVCTAPGMATFTLSGGTSVAVPIFVNAGAFQTLPFAITGIVLSGGAAGSFGVFS